VIILAAALAFQGCASKPAKPGPAGPSLGALSDPADGIRHFTLPNGLQVVVVERPVVPLVTILAAVKNGSMTETPEINGLSHLYEHMFFKGNAEIPDQSAYLKRMRELGMSFNATTSTEAVRYFFTLPKENLKAGLAFMRPALMSPLFAEEELNREIKTVLAEYDRNEASPYFHLSQAASKALFPLYPSRKNVIGEREAIAAATREKMQAIQTRYYAPNNTLLVVAGDVTEAEIRPLIEELYLAWPKAADPFDLHPVPVEPPLAENREIVVEHPFQNVLLQFGWHGPSVDRDRSATYAADVFSYVLDQRTSRFQKRLVDSGLLLSANLGYYTQRHIGPIYFTGLAAPEKAKAALEAMRAEIDEFMKPDYIDESELETAKLMLAAENLYGWQKSLSIANELGFWWCVADLDYRLRYIENLKRVTRDDIRNYAERYVAGKPYVLGVLVSPENRARLEEAVPDGAAEPVKTDEEAGR